MHQGINYKNENAQHLMFNSQFVKYICQLQLCKIIHCMKYFQMYLWNPILFVIFKKCSFLGDLLFYMLYWQCALVPEKSHWTLDVSHRWKAFSSSFVNHTSHVQTNCKVGVTCMAHKAIHIHLQIILDIILDYWSDKLVFYGR